MKFYWLIEHSTEFKLKKKFFFSIFHYLWTDGECEQRRDQRHTKWIFDVCTSFFFFFVCMVCLVRFLLLHRFQCFNQIIRRFSLKCLMLTFSFSHGCNSLQFDESPKKKSFFFVFFSVFFYKWIKKPVQLPKNFNLWSSFVKFFVGLCITSKDQFFFSSFVDKEIKCLR